MNKYVKPNFFVEKFTLQSNLCSCAVTTKTLSVDVQCGYYLDDIGITVFGDGWSSCSGVDSSSFGYCYQIGAVNVFSS